MRIRHKWNAECAASRNRHRCKIEYLECNGSMTCACENWDQEIRRFCCEKYIGVTIDEHYEVERPAWFRSVERDTGMDCVRAQTMNVDILFAARAKLATGNCARCLGSIVAEMILLLPIVVVYLVAHFFAERYESNESDHIESWRHIVLVFLAKMRLPTTLRKSFRGISLLSVLCKWYVGCLIALAARTKAPAICNQICVVGYFPGCSIDLIIGFIKHFMHVGSGWRGRIKEFIFNGDIGTAFDNLSIEVVEHSFRFMRLHPRLIAAFVAEMQQLRCRLEFANLLLDIYHSRFQQMCAPMRQGKFLCMELYNVRHHVRSSTFVV